jgi:4-diphosphocytidyl-2-C-methyl-D-erythritol kinase
MKALRLMQRLYGVGEARICLDKRVPFGAGLGGGSSDATAVILALNELYELGLSEVQLIEAAAMIGSDTAFFVRNTPQLCTGRGEKMIPIELPLQGKYLAIAKPEEGVSTKEAYAGVKPAVPAVRLADALKSPMREWRRVVKNDFEPHIFAAHPTISELKNMMYEAGAVYASMSGSGSAVFGIFDQAPKFDNINTKYLKITQL